MKIDKDELEQILLGKHQCEERELKEYLANEMKLHAYYAHDLVCGLLNKKFPSEPDYILQYRIQNYSYITKTYFDKILNTLGEIQRSDDFVISYPDSAVEEYCTSKIECFGSINNWFWQFGLKAMLIDANSVIVVLPIYGTDQPQLHYFESSQIYAYKPDEFIVIKTFESGDVKQFMYVDKEHVSFIVVNPKERETEKQYTIIDKFRFYADTEDELEKLPVVVLGGDLHRLEFPYLYESFINGVCPFWTSALIEYSDKMCGIKQHVYPEKWRIQLGTCKNCNGDGKIIVNGQAGNCYACNGTGSPPTGMFSEVVIEPGSPLLGESVKGAPMGYVQKDFAAIEFLDRDYQKNIYAGLAAIHMEFLDASPLNQSGVAKEMDRQGINSFVYKIANHVVHNILLPIHEIIIELLNLDTINFNPKKLMPHITVPVHYTFTGANDYEAKLISAQNSNVSPSVKAAIERKFIEKRFENFGSEKDYLLMVNNLDPLPGLTLEQKIQLMNAGGVTLNDFVASTNIETIVKFIINEKKRSPNWDFDKQKELLNLQVKKIISEISKNQKKSKKQENANKNNNPTLFDPQRGNYDGNIYAREGGGDTEEQSEGME